MGLIKTSGIVTREVKYGETSKIVTIITHDLGKISAIANNARSKKSGMLAGLQLFAYSEFVLFKSKGKKSLYHLDEVTLIEDFRDIRSSLEKLAYSSYFAEVINSILPEENPDEELLRLLLNTFFVLNRDLHPHEKIKLVFQWRAVSVAGYSPFLDSCSICNSRNNFSHLDPCDGRVLCDVCSVAKPSAIPLNDAMINIISYIANADSKQIFSFDTNTDTLLYLSRVGEIYLETQLEHKFQTLDYLKKVTAL